MFSPLFLSIGAVMIAIACFSAVLLRRYLKGGLTLSIPAVVIQKAVRKALPVTRQIGGLDLQISDATVSLLAENRVRIVTGLNASRSGFTARADLQLSAALAYRATKFYLSGCVIEEVSIGKITLLSPEAGDAADGSWTSALQSAFRAVGGEDRVDAMVSGYRSSLEDLLKAQGGAVIGAVLEHIPVYTLPSDSRDARLARGSLRSVQTRQDRMDVVLGYGAGSRRADP